MGNRIGLSAVQQAGISQLDAIGLTPGTPIPTISNTLNETWYKWSVTNANIIALGASTTGDIALATLPAGSILRVYGIILGTSATGTASLTLDFKVTGYANPVTGFDLQQATPAKITGSGATFYNVSTTTDIKLGFTSTGANLNQVIGGDFTFYLCTAVLPS